MSTMDDPFDDIVRGLTFDLPDVLDVTTLTNIEIAEMIGNIETDLRKMDQLLWPVTQEGRDKHSLRNSLQVEMERRKRGGLM